MEVIYIVYTELKAPLTSYSRTKYNSNQIAAGLDENVCQRNEYEMKQQSLVNNGDVGPEIAQVNTH